MFGAFFPINLSSFALLLVASPAGNNGASPPSRLQALQFQSHHLFLHARAECDIGWKPCLPDGCAPLLAVCCDDGTYCPEGTKCVGTTLCCPGFPGCPGDSSVPVSTTGAPSTQTAQRSSASDQTSSALVSTTETASITTAQQSSLSEQTSSQAESPSSFDYVSAISEYISVFTEVTQLIITTTASDGNTSVTTEEVPYTTTVTVSANSPANASAQFNATASILSNTAPLISSSSGATASSSSSGAAKMVGWTGASIAWAVLVIFLVSVLFNQQ